MNDGPGPSRARDIVEELEAKIVDLDAAAERPEPRDLENEDLDAAAPSAAEPPD